MESKNNFNVSRLVMIGFMAALCFIATLIHIPVVIGGFNSMIHLGTTAIFITAVLIGKDAGLSAAIGLSLFDLLDPAYAMWAPFTFVIKGLTGYTAGLIAFGNDRKGNNMKWNILGFILGGTVSLLGYFLAGRFFYGSWAVALAHTITSVTTTAIGVAIAIPLSKVLKSIIPKSIKSAA